MSLRHTIFSCLTLTLFASALSAHSLVRDNGLGLGTTPTQTVPEANPIIVLASLDNLCNCAAVRIVASLNVTTVVVDGDNDNDKCRPVFCMSESIAAGNEGGITDAAGRDGWESNLGMIIGSGAARAPPAIPRNHQMSKSTVVNGASSSCSSCRHGQSMKPSRHHGHDDFFGHVRLRSTDVRPLAEEAFVSPKSMLRSTPAASENQ